LIVLLRRRPDPLRLFRLGRAGIQNLILLDAEDLSRAIPHALQRSAERSATAMVTRVMSPHLPFRELNAIRVAMDGVDYRWSAERFAEIVGLSRPFLSERLKACRLPSTGHLLLWTRLLHAGMWLEEPGRTGESVSRQLEYSSGAAFRRALKMYTGATPTEVVEEGGVSFVLARFLQACGLSRAASQLSAG
jgi:AraC-like DNA-binding protein